MLDFGQMAEDSSTTLLKRLEISVAEAEKRTGKNSVNMQETYTVYLIETRWDQAVHFCYTFTEIEDKV